MPERAALIGGKLAVWSEVGAGTELELRLAAQQGLRNIAEPVVVVTPVRVEDGAEARPTHIMSRDSQ
jgi:hypothetical protein